MSLSHSDQESTFDPLVDDKPIVGTSIQEMETLPFLSMDPSIESKDNHIVCFPGTSLEDIAFAAANLNPHQTLQISDDIDPCDLLLFSDIPLNNIFSSRDIILPFEKLNRIYYAALLVKPKQRLIFPDHTPLNYITDLWPFLTPGSILKLPKNISAIEAGMIAESCPLSITLELHSNTDIVLPAGIDPRKAERASRLLHKGRILKFTNGVSKAVINSAVLNLPNDTILSLHTPDGILSSDLMIEAASNLINLKNELIVPFVSPQLAGKIMQVLVTFTTVHLDERQNILLPSDINIDNAILSAESLRPGTTLIVQHGLSIIKAEKIGAALAMDCHIDFLKNTEMSTKLAIARTLKESRHFHAHEIEIDTDLLGVANYRGIVPISPEDAGELTTVVPLSSHLYVNGLIRLPTGTSLEIMQRGIYVAKEIAFEGVQTEDLTTLKFKPGMTLVLPQFKTSEIAAKFAKKLPNDITLILNKGEDEEAEEQKIAAIENLPLGATLKLFGNVNLKNAKKYGTALQSGRKLNIMELTTDKNIAPTELKEDKSKALSGQKLKARTKALSGLKPGCIVVFGENNRFSSKKWPSIIHAIPDNVILEIDLDQWNSLNPFLLKRKITLKITRSSNPTTLGNLIAQSDQTILLNKNIDVALPSNIPQENAIRLVKAIQPGGRLIIQNPVKAEDAPIILRELNPQCKLILHLQEKDDPKNWEIVLKAVKDGMTVGFTGSINKIGVAAQFIKENVKIDIFNSYNIILPEGCTLATAKRLAEIQTNRLKNSLLYESAHIETHFKLHDAKPADAVEIVKKLTQRCTLDLSQCQSDSIEAVLPITTCQITWDASWTNVNYCKSMKSNVIIFPETLPAAIKRLVITNAYQKKFVFNKLQPEDAEIISKLTEGSTLLIRRQPQSNREWRALEKALQKVESNRNVELPEWIIKSDELQKFLGFLSDGVNIVVGPKNSQWIRELTLQHLPHFAALIIEKIDPDDCGKLINEAAAHDARVYIEQTKISFPRGMDMRFANLFVKQEKDSKDHWLVLPPCSNKLNYELLSNLNKANWTWSLPESITSRVAYHFIKHMPELEMMESYIPHDNTIVEKAVQKAYLERKPKKVRIRENKEEKETKESKEESNLDSDSTMKIATSLNEASSIEIETKSKAEDRPAQISKLEHPLTLADLLAIAKAVRVDPITQAVINAEMNCALLIAALRNGFLTGIFQLASARDTLFADFLFTAITVIERRIVNNISQLCVVSKNEKWSLQNGSKDGLSRNLIPADLLLRDRLEEKENHSEFKQSSVVKIESSLETDDFVADEVHIDDLNDFLLTRAAQEEGYYFCVIPLKRFKVIANPADENEINEACKTINVGHVCAAYASVMNGQKKVYFIDPQRIVDSSTLNAAVTTDINSFYNFKEGDFDIYVNIVHLDSRRMKRMRDEAQIRSQKTKSEDIVMSSENEQQNRKRNRDGDTHEPGAEWKKTKNGSPSIWNSSIPMFNNNYPLSTDWLDDIEMEVPVKIEPSSTSSSSTS